MSGIPDRGNEKPALSKARQKEKARGEEFVRHSARIFIEQLDFLHGIDPSTRCHRNSKGF